MKKVFVSLGLLLTLGLANVAAQDYVGTFSGTLTITPPIVYTLGDVNDINVLIEDQTFQVGTDHVGWYDMPIFNEGEPVNIGFVNVEFTPNGTGSEQHFAISAPNIDGANGTVTFSIVSGTVSNTAVTLTVHMVDKATGGTQADVTFTYTGTKQASTGINEIVTTEKIIAGYYSITGQKLDKEPQSGIYIVKYNNGTSEKVMKK